MRKPGTQFQRCSSPSFSVCSASCIFRVTCCVLLDNIVYEWDEIAMYLYLAIVGISTLAYAVLGMIYIHLFKKPSFVVVTIYSIGSLFAACLWIWFLSNFVVDTLTLIGFITELPSSFLGVTLLAMGNCVGDFIADISIANLDLVDMAITGTYSSPTFNLLLGFGSVIIINCSVAEYFCAISLY